MPDIVVLCYHAVSQTWPADLSVRPDAFRAQLAKLVGRGYRGATVTQALLQPRTGKTVCVTFDDAYASVLTEAFPILRELGLPATVYAPSVFVGSDEPMSWPGI
ncbi:MAG TPA: polysaccharide deacetylase family protein, partial [Planctomycetota bacterium]|nr:polysaccharide deacetylase family protein [Planctomycetota bacterium]